MTVPYLFRFRSAVFSDADPCEVSYDSHSQVSVSEGNSLAWKAYNTRTGVWTPGYHVPPHTTASGRRVTGHRVLGKTDKRAGQ